MADGLFGLLSDLSEIQEQREVLNREETLLQKFINLEQGILLHAVRYILIDNFSKRINQLLNKQPNDDSEEFSESGMISSIYSCLTKEMETIEFSEKDLNEYILARANYDDRDSFVSWGSGLFSGFLISLMTERNQAQGKRTRFYINGRGNSFDHLFAFARTVDELVVENFCGDYICNCIGSNGGVANQVVGLNIRGNYALAGIGTNGGKVGLVLGVGIKGRGALLSIGSNRGDVKYVLGFNIEGDNALYNIGNDKGNIGLVCGYDIIGKGVLEAICNDDSKGEIIIGINITGDNALSFCGSNKGNVGLLYGININGYGALSYAAHRKGNVKLVVGENITNINNEPFSLYKTGALSFIASKEGHVEVVVGNKITARSALSHIGFENGRIGKLVAIAVKGEEALSYIGCDNEKRNAIMDYLLECELSVDLIEMYEKRLGYKIEPDEQDTNKIPPNFIGEEYEKVNEVLCDEETNVTPLKLCCNKLVIGNQAVEEYERIMKEYKLNELVETVRSMYGQPYQEIIRIVETLKLKEWLINSG
ncbi:hypothetical protein HY636_03240 [Candidatus Woesearchaeota archaeon]|nr:hypothetical protein [Candidatus Woesearchaeota archaeon]